MSTRQELVQAVLDAAKDLPACRKRMDKELKPWFDQGLDGLDAEEIILEGINGALTRSLPPAHARDAGRS